MLLSSKRDTRIRVFVFSTRKVRPLSLLPVDCSLMLLDDEQAGINAHDVIEVSNHRLSGSNDTIHVVRQK